MAVFGATGGASKASDRCSFTKISENNKDWYNGRGKPTPLRKASGIVRFWRGWCEARDGGVAIPPVVARILSGDSTSPLTRDGHGCPKLNARSFAGRKTNRAFIRQG